MRRLNGREMESSAALPNQNHKYATVVKSDIFGVYKILKYIKRCFCLTSDVCLSVAYIGPNSRTERPRKTKIGTEVDHVNRD